MKYKSYKTIVNTDSETIINYKTIVNNIIIYNTIFNIVSYFILDHAKLDSGYTLK